MVLSQKWPWHALGQHGWWPVTSQIATGFLGTLGTWLVGLSYFYKNWMPPELIKKYTGSMKREGFTALEASSTVWEGGSWMHQPSSAVSISCRDSRHPSRSQKNQVWVQCLNFLWEVVIMSCLLAEGISGLVQRISDSSLISFSFLQRVWSMFCTYKHSICPKGHQSA